MNDVLVVSPEPLVQHLSARQRVYLLRVPWLDAPGLLAELRDAGDFAAATLTGWDGKPAELLVLAARCPAGWQARALSGPEPARQARTRFNLRRPEETRCSPAWRGLLPARPAAARPPPGDGSATERERARDSATGGLACDRPPGAA
jgi:hypothetical protein